eukprot:361463_1
MTTQKKLQIYGAAISQPTREVIWLCAMNDIPYDFIEENVGLSRKHESRVKYIKNINPNGRVPAIKDVDGFVLYEAAAIVMYLCDKYNWKYLYPRDLYLRAKIDEYIHWHHENIRPITPTYVGPLVRYDVPFKNWLTKTDILKRRKLIKISLDIIENKRLNGNQYIVNNQLSIADILCFEEIAQLLVWNLLDPGTNLGWNGDGRKYFETNYPNIYQWLNRIKSLPKHDEVHQIMISKGVLSLIKNQSIQFAKAERQYQSKL